MSTESSFLLDLICFRLNVSHKNTLHSELAYQTISSMDSSIDCTLSTVGPPEVWKPKAAFGFSHHDFRISVPMLCFEKLSWWWFCTIKKILLSVRRTNQATHGDRTPYPVPVKTTVLIVTHALIQIWEYIRAHTCIYVYIRGNTRSLGGHTLGMIATHPYGWCSGICNLQYSFLLATPFCLGNIEQAQTVILTEFGIMIQWSLHVILC